MIKIGIIGKVKSLGRYADWYVLIEERQETFHGKQGTSYYLFLGQSPEVKSGYDTWLPDYGSVIATMNKWGLTEIEWLDET